MIQMFIWDKISSSSLLDTVLSEGGRNSRTIHLRRSNRVAAMVVAWNGGHDCFRSKAISSNNDLFNRILERAIMDCRKLFFCPSIPGETGWLLEIKHPQILVSCAVNRVDAYLPSGGMMVLKNAISFVTGVGMKMTKSDNCINCRFFERFA